MHAHAPRLASSNLGLYYNVMTLQVYTDPEAPNGLPGRLRGTARFRVSQLIPGAGRDIYR